MATLQSTLDQFNFLSKDWYNNIHNDRILGVSLTGLRDHPVLSKVSAEAKQWLRILRKTAWEVSQDYAFLLGINPPKAITSVKPSGTVSQLVNTASGMHPRYSSYYIRRVRIAKGDPLAQMLISQKIPYHCEVGQTEENCFTYVFDFYIKSPNTSVKTKDVSAIEQLEYWKMIKENYTDHNPSVTIMVGEDEWEDVRKWVWINKKILAGVSFLPKDDSIYELAPYEEITEEEYNKATKKKSLLDFSKLTLFEHEDHTEGSREYACTGGSCEL